MKVFLSLCLLFSLVSPAVLLTCTACKNQKRTECMKNHTERCVYSEHSCTSIVVNGNLLPIVERASYGCGFCEAGHYSFNTGSDGFFSMIVNCCESKTCNAEPVKIPSEPMKPNGRECSGCYAEGQEECIGTGSVRCVGDQTKCMKMSIEFSSTISDHRKTFSARGCATPEMCEELRVMEHLIASEYTPFFSTLKCSDAV